MIDGNSLSFRKEKTLVVQDYVKGASTPHSDCESWALRNGRRTAVPENKVMPDLSQIDSTCSLDKGLMIGTVIYPTRREGASSASLPKRGRLLGHESRPKSRESRYEKGALSCCISRRVALVTRFLQTFIEAHRIQIWQTR